MLIGHDYKIESDSLNVTLYQRQTSKKSGKEYWKSIGSFSNPKEALYFLSNLKVKESGMKDLETVVKRQDEIKKMILSLTKLPTINEKPS